MLQVVTATTGWLWTWVTSLCISLTLKQGERTTTTSKVRYFVLPPASLSCVVRRSGPYASHLVKLTRKNFERLSHHFGETFVPHSSSTTLEVGDNFPLRDYNLQPMESVVARPNPRSVRYVTVDGERKEVPDVQDDEPLQQPKHSK